MRSRLDSSLRHLALALAAALTIGAPTIAQVRDARRELRRVPDGTPFNVSQLTEEAARNAGLTLIPKVSQELRAMAATEETLHVFIYLRDQPLRQVYNRVASTFDERLADAEDRLLSLIKEGAASRARLREARVALDDTVVEMRGQVAAELGLLIGPQQDQVEKLLENLGAGRIQRFRLLNLLSTQIPSSAFSTLMQDARIAEIAIVEKQEPELDVSTLSLNADFFWNAGFFGEGESVAVLDSGVNAGHPAFAGRVQSASFLDADFNSCPIQEIDDPSDFRGHGTHVAGIIASQGTAAFPLHWGVAPGISTLYNFKVSCFDGSSFTPDVLRAIEAALKLTPTTVINSSNGGLPAEDNFVSRLIDQFVDIYDLTFVKSAGNGGPAPSTVTSPGQAFNIITVANIDNNGTPTRSDDVIAKSSSRGPTINGRFKPDLAAPGENIYSTDFLSDGFVSRSGTSMAAPHIAGVAALLRQAGVRNRLPIKALLINTTDIPGWDPAYGWGYADLALALEQMDNISPGKLGSDVGAFDLVTGALSSGETLSATLTWNRFFPGGMPFLRNIDLGLYDGAELVSLSNSDSDNVEQVLFANTDEQDKSVVLKVKALNSGFGNTEPYALALSHAGFTVAIGPALEQACTGPTAVGPGAEVVLDCTVSNSGDVPAFDVRPASGFFAPLLPEGELLAAPRVVSQGRLDLLPGEATDAQIVLTAPTEPGRYVVAVRAESASYGETFLSNEQDLMIDVGTPSGDPGPTIGQGAVVLATGTPVIPSITPSSIVTLFGNEFAPEGTLVLQAELDGEGKVSTNLANTCVEINGQRSSLFAVLPTQINLQASDQLAPGNGSVVVIRDCETENEQRSEPRNVAINSAAPGFFNFVNSGDGKNPIAALHGGGPALLGPADLFPGASTPANPGEFVSLFATGLGLTNPAFGVGEIPGSVASVTGEVSVSIGGIALAPGDVFYAGVAPCCAGLYQLVVKVPENALDGNLEVIVTIDGVSSPAGPFIAVKRE